MTIGTNYKTITLEFNKELSEAQEDVLIASFQFITERAKKQLEKTQRGYSSTNSFILGEQGKTIKRTIAMTLENFDKMFILDKDGNKYIFKMESRLNSLSINFGFVKLDYWQKLKSVYMKFFYKQVLPQMQISEHDVKVSYSE